MKSSAAILMSVVIVVIGLALLVGYLITQADEMRNKNIISDNRLQPEKQFPILGKVESITFNDGNVAVVSILPQSTPEQKIRRVYIFGSYIANGEGTLNPKTFCKRTFELKEIEK